MWYFQNSLDDRSLFPTIDRLTAESGVRFHNTVDDIFHGVVADGKLIIHHRAGTVDGGGFPTRRFDLRQWEAEEWQSLHVIFRQPGNTTDVDVLNGMEVMTFSEQRLISNQPGVVQSGVLIMSVFRVSPSRLWAIAHSPFLYFTQLDEGIRLTKPFGETAFPLAVQERKISDIVWAKDSVTVQVSDGVMDLPMTVSEDYVQMGNQIVISIPSGTGLYPISIEVETYLNDFLPEKEKLIRKFVVYRGE